MGERTAINDKGGGAVIDPIPMRLMCPSCGALHLDVGEFATKVHHTHACQECGHVWRPAVVPTVGVRFLPGFKNDSSEAADDLDVHCGAALIEHYADVPWQTFHHEPSVAAVVLDAVPDDWAKIDGEWVRITSDGVGYGEFDRVPDSGQQITLPKSDDNGRGGA